MSMKDLKAKFNFENYGHMSVTNFEIVEITNEHGTYRGLLVIKDASSNDYKIIGRGNGCAIEHMIDASDDNENILIMSYCKKNGWLKGGLPFFRIFSHYWSHVGVVKALSAGVTFLEQRGATKINMYGQSLGGHHIPQILKYNPLNKEGVNYSMQLDVSFPNLDKLASRIVFGGLPKKVLEWFVDPLVKLIFFTLRLRSDFKLENYIDTVNKLTHLRIGNVENDQIVKLPASFYQYIQDNKGEFTAEAAKKIHVQLDNELNILVWKKCDNGYFRHSIVKRKDFYNEINKSELKVEEHATCNEEDVSFSQIPYSDVTRRDPSMYVEVPNVYVNGRPLNSFEESLRAVDSEPSHNEFKFDEKNWQPLVEEEVAE